MTLVGILATMFLSLIAQFMYFEIVKPWQIQRALVSGCKVIVSIDRSKPFSDIQEVSIISAFSRAAWLDPHYLDLVQASALYSSVAASNSLSNLYKNANYSAGMLLLGFCSNQYNRN